MVDFNKLRSRKKAPEVIDPSAIFRRLPKPKGINDLYTSQAAVLEEWFESREKRDVVVKLHTGGGKTLVGLLMGRSVQNEHGEPALYLTPTVQLVSQTMELARAYGIPAVEYESGRPLNDDFINGKAILVGTYKALFNGKTKFGLRGSAKIQRVGVVIADDAHVAFSIIRDSFTIEVDSEKKRDLYEELTGLFRKAFKDVSKLGTFDDTVSGSEYGVLEVPYWAWHEQRDAVRELLKAHSEDYAFAWPLLRDRLHLCHSLVSRNAFTVSPLLPFVDLFPTFSEAPRRIYMSATIADDSEIVRTFDADRDLIHQALTSRSLAGISERMILLPDLMPFKFDVQKAIEKLAQWVAGQNLGAVILVPSDKAAQQWSAIASVAKGSEEVESMVAELQARKNSGPVVFANRYDGIDLPEEACRLLVIFGLPRGTSDYEVYRASALHAGSTISRMLAQRIEQGIGRGARGSGDHCVVLMAGSDLAGWIGREANYRLLTNATRAQVEIGRNVSTEVGDLKELARTIQRSFERDTEWVEYHAETLDELVGDEEVDTESVMLAAVERKAIDLWRDGYYDKAISRIEAYLNDTPRLDSQVRGWMQQLAARIAHDWGNDERAQDLQRQAFANNRNLVRPQVPPPYRPLATPGSQERNIASNIGGYRLRRGFLQSFEVTVATLVPEASARQFEQALADLGSMLGFSAERFDDDGEGPDVLWLLANSTGLIFEAKSRKKAKNALTKEQHGQLLVAAEWFGRNYPEYSGVRVSVHPTNCATKPADAGGSYALTYTKLSALVSDARKLFTTLCESQLSDQELVDECSRILRESSLRSEQLVERFLQPFVVCEG